MRKARPREEARPWWEKSTLPEYDEFLDLAVWALKKYKVDSDDIFRFEQLWALREGLAEENI